jgi:outer membrane receptor protein involved in Fe transport
MSDSENTRGRPLPIAGSALCAAALLAAPTGASAQLAVGTGDDRGTLEEIVVTAQKRTERLQDVPLAVAALGETQLQQQGIHDIHDIARSLPGVSFTSSQPTRSVVVMRGISPIGGQPTVGLYVDDIPITGSIGQYSGSPEPEILDTERVEVLKGPQGTLYGASSMGGAIKLVSAQPDPTALEGTVSGSVGTTEGGSESYGARLIVNVPLLTDKVALRLGGAYRDEGGYIDQQVGTNWADLFFRTDPQTLAPVETPSENAVARSDVNDMTSLGLRASLMIAPDPTLTITPSFWYQDNDYGDFGLRWSNLPGVAHGQVFDQPASTSISLGTLNITKDFGAVALTSLTGYFEHDQTLDIDYTFFVRSLLRGSPPAPLFDPVQSLWEQKNEAETWSQELRLQSSGEARLTWLAGLYFSDDERRNTTTVTSAGISGIVPPFLAPLVENDIVFGVGPTNRKLREYAVFGEVTYGLTSSLDLTLGLRWFDIEQEVFRPAFGLFNGGDTLDETESDEDGFNPKATLTYRFSESQLLYLTASKGFRPGGANTAVPTAQCADSLAELGRDSAPIGFESDRLWNFEIGSKNTFAGDRWIVNGAVFYIDWSDIQQSVALSCGFSFIDNVGKAESQGFELEVHGRPVDWLSLDAGVVYTDAEITETVPGVTAQSGDRLLGTPEWIYNLAAEVTFPVFSTFAGYLRLDHQWRDEQLQSFTDTIDVALQTGGMTTIPDPASVQDSYGLTNLSLGITSDRWEARAYVTNVFDDDAVIDPSSALRLPQESIVRPRRFGIDVRFSF